MKTFHTWAMTVDEFIIVTVAIIKQKIKGVSFVI